MLVTTTVTMMVMVIKSNGPDDVEMPKDQEQAAS